MCIEGNFGGGVFRSGFFLHFVFWSGEISPVVGVGDFFFGFAWLGGEAPRVAVYDGVLTTRGVACGESC